MKSAKAHHLVNQNKSASAPPNERLHGTLDNKNGAVLMKSAKAHYLVNQNKKRVSATKQAIVAKYLLEFFCSPTV